MWYTTLFGGTSQLVADVAPAVRQVDGTHRVDVDDQVVRAAEDVVDHAVDEAGDDGDRQLRRMVVDGGLEVGRDDEPRCPRARLTPLVRVEVGDERAVRDHRGDTGHAVRVGREGGEPAHQDTDTAHRSDDDRRDGSTAGERRDRARVGGDEVGVEVGEVRPAGLVGELGPGVGGPDEDGPVDLSAPGQPGQHRLDEAAGGEAATAVTDDVQRHLASAEGREQVGQVAGVLERVDAERPVVEADDRVVVGERLGEERPPGSVAARPPKAPRVESKVPWTKSRTRLFRSRESPVSASEPTWRHSAGSTPARWTSPGSTTSSSARIAAAARSG